jgi:hypothetical protein
MNDMVKDYFADGHACLPVPLPQRMGPAEWNFAGLSEPGLRAYFSGGSKPSTMTSRDLAPRNLCGSAA